MNKLLLVTFAVVACSAGAAAASVTTIADKAANNLSVQLLGENELTPEQKKCIDEANKKAKEDDPEFGKWLDKVSIAKKMFRDRAEKCRELENELEQRKCLDEVETEKKKEISRLSEELIDNGQFGALLKLEREHKKCMAAQTPPEHSAGDCVKQKSVAFVLSSSLLAGTLLYLS